ncbi:hypothetical protein B4U79_00028, partial [Dinothrombium tinctorium]
IGAIDGTHIEVLKSAQEKFRNRKNRISVNVQAVVDADMRFKFSCLFGIVQSGIL